MATLTLTNQMPPLPEYDFEFCINFNREAGSVSRVFAATRDFVQACERLDHGLISSIDSNIEPLIMLEDVEVGSLKTFFRLTLLALDDQALKEGDWKVVVGKFLYQAKYLLLSWMDDQTRPPLDTLSRRIQQAAESTDVRHLPDYIHPKRQLLVDAVKDFQSVKEHLIDGDSAYVEDNSGMRHDMNMTIKVDINDMDDLMPIETELNRVSMRLIVKRPDYLGESQWEFRHGNRIISAKIEDYEWLRRFQKREIDVRPSDALNCTIRIEQQYDLDNELKAERFFVEHVKGVIEYPQDPQQQNLLS